MQLAAAEFAILEDAIHRGLRDASQGLRTMTTGNVELHQPRLQFLPLHDVPGIAGGPAAVVTAVYLGVTDDLSGHLMLLFGTESALRVVDLLLDQPPGSQRDLDEIACSALAEAGNICGSQLLNALSNRTGLRVTPTTPAVVTDMAGAILQQVVAELYLAGEEVLVVETRMGDHIRGHFLLLPDQDSMARLVTALEALE